MPRDVQTPISLPTAKAGTPFFLNNPTPYVWAPANDAEFAITGDGREFVFVFNATGGVSSVSTLGIANSFGRTVTGSGQIAAGDYGVVGPFSREGWEQTGGVIHIDCDVAVEALFLRF